MKATAIIRELSDQFWNGFGESIPAFLSQSPLAQFQSAERLAHEMADDDDLDYARDVIAKAKGQQ